MTTVLQFDTFGYLTPDDAIETDLQTLERVFVEEFPTSTTRRGHFERFSAYNARLREILPAGFTQWINGSFISRKLNPNDMDVLTFVDHSVYGQVEQALRALKGEFTIDAGGWVDAYTIQVYPEGHPNRSHYKSDYMEWQFIWSQTNSRPRRKKGFIKLVTV